MRRHKEIALAVRFLRLCKMNIAVAENILKHNRRRCLLRHGCSLKKQKRKKRENSRRRRLDRASREL